MLPSLTGTPMPRSEQCCPSSRRTARGPSLAWRSHSPKAGVWHAELTSFSPRRWQGGWNRNGPPSVPLQEVQMDIIRQRKPRTSMMTLRRKHKGWSLMWSLWSNPITPTIVPSSQTVPLFIVNAAQQKIGTGRELDEDWRPRIPTGLRMPRRGSKAELRTERSPRWCCPCSETPKRKGR